MLETASPHLNDHWLNLEMLLALEHIWKVFQKYEQLKPCYQINPLKLLFNGIYPLNDWFACYISRCLYTLEITVEILQPSSQ